MTAYMESQSNGPFRCLECNEEVILKTGRTRVNHFAHANPIACKFAEGESAAHRHCKIEIYLALKESPGVEDVALERAFGEVRPDVSARINGVPVAIEVQISSLSIETIMRRTIDYYRKGICVLWLLQWTPKLDAPRYTPKLWEKWIHAAYFGRVYYWVEGLKVVSYHFDPTSKTVPKKSWYSEDGEKISVGGYPRLSLASFEKRAHVSDSTLQHELEVMDVKAAFHSAITKTPSLAIEEFSTWPLLAPYYSRPAPRMEGAVSRQS